MFTKTQINPNTIKLGYWSALLATLAWIVFTVCFIALVMINPLFTWTNLADYVVYTNQYPSLLPDLARLMVILIGVLYVILFSCIHDLAPAEQKVFTRISLAFALGFAILTGANYFIQISAVRLALIKGTLAGLEQVVQANPYSAISAMNMLGWTVFLGAASLFAAPVFSGGRLEKVIRVTFLLNGLFCMLSAAAYVFELIVPLFLLINLGMGSAVIVISAALALLFWQKE
ncbi:MAG: hypothetical protein QNJ45_07525 [Ardenticatenaceae bacterium]|nr:hypothetical protein [Ardenticatenaceae bacterium]